jgi:recombinational DNA repair ATPase RecF
METFFQKKFGIESIKIENFKSYKKPSVFGTTEMNGCLIGKNGVGKTNFSDALVFVFGGSLKDINCLSIESLFPDFIQSKNFLTSKIGLLITYGNMFMELIRTVDINGISEFFLNGNSVSFFHFRSIVRNMNINNFKDLMILKDLPNNLIFLQNKNLIQIIYRISNSEKLFKFRLRINLLKKKLRENYFFYLEKIKFISSEKTLLEKEKKILIEMIRIKKKTKEKRVYFYFFKIFFYQHENLKVKKINKKNLFDKEELKYQKSMVIFSLNKYNNPPSKIIKKRNKIKNILTDCRFFKKKLQEIVATFLKIQMNFYIFCLSKLIECIHLQKNKIKTLGFGFLVILIPNQKHFKYYLFQKIFIKFLFFFKINQSATHRVTNVLNEDKKISKKIIKYLVPLPEYYGFTMFLILSNIVKKFFIKNWYTNLSYEKTINNTFFCTISFILTLIFVKEHSNLEEKYQIKLISFVSDYINKFPYGIRGFIKDIFKPLDSKYKFIVKYFTDKDLNTMIVDNLKIVLKCIQIIKKTKITQIAFLSKKELNKTAKQFGFNFLTNFKIILKYLEIDYYDLNFLFFIMRKNLSLKKTKFFSSTIISNEVPNDFSNKKNSIIEDIKYQTISFLPHIALNKEITIDKKTYFKKKNLVTGILNRKIKLSVKKKFFYIHFCEMINHHCKLFLIIYHKILKKATLFLSLSVSISSKICAFSIIFYVFYKIYCFQVTIASSNINKNKVKNVRSKYHRFFVKKIIFYIFQIRKRFGSFYKKNNDLLISQKSKINLNLSKFLNKNCFVIIETKKFFSYLCSNINVKLMKYSIFLNNFDNLRKTIYIFLMRLYNSFFSKKNYSKCNNKKINIISKIMNLLFIFKDVIFYKSANSMPRILLWKIILNLHKKHNQIDLSIFFQKKCAQQFFKEINLRLKDVDTMYQHKRMITITNSSLLEKRIEFVKKRLIFLKKKLIKNRYQQLLINVKLKKIQKKINDKIEFILKTLSERVNLIYKKITKTLANPLGGTAFLNFSLDRFSKLEKVIYIAIPSLRKTNDYVNLSGGEKTIASLALIMAINTIHNPPIILTDELDFNLDNWHAEKIIKYLIKWSEKEKVQIYMITLKLKFTLLFNNITFIFKNIKGSDFYNLII